MINFSIIIPHKNIPTLLYRCLDSIPMRDDIQVIVVDDNSNNHIVHFNKRYPHFEYFVNKKGNGAGAARNIGLEKALGKWIIFADADDFFTSNLSEMMDKYNESDSDVILFPIKIVNSDTLEEGEWRTTNFNKLVMDKKKTNKYKLLETAALWSKFIKRSMIETHKIRCEEIFCSNDQMFSAKVAIYAQNIICDSTNYIYTLTYRTDSLTRHKDRQTFDCRLSAELRFYSIINQHNITIQRSTYHRYISWAAVFGFECLFDTHKQMKIAQVKPYDNTFLESIPFLFFKALIKTIWYKIKII